MDLGERQEMVNEGSRRDLLAPNIIARTGVESRLSSFLGWQSQLYCATCLFISIQGAHNFITSVNDVSLRVAMG